MLTVNFDYHMYGADMGTLMLQASDNGGSTWLTSWSRSGQQSTNGTDWKSASVDVKFFGEVAPVSVKLRFFYITDNASGYTADAAIDNISITDDNGTYNTDFETDFGDWADGGGTFSWTRNTGSTGSSLTGPDTASVGSYYVYTETSSSGLDDTFILDNQLTFDTEYEPVATSSTEEFIRYQDSLLAFGYVGSTVVVAVYRGTTKVTAFK